jgi:malonate decarboxylase alpha subunit
MGHDPHGRRHSTPAWLSLINADSQIVRGRKLVVQMVETYAKGGEPAFVETLDAVEVGKRNSLPVAPVMIYGDGVTHVVTEEGALRTCSKQRIRRNAERRWPRSLGSAR